MGEPSAEKTGRLPARKPGPKYLQPLSWGRLDDDGRKFVADSMFYRAVAAYNAGRSLMTITGLIWCR
jgi:hypothetical protein